MIAFEYITIDGVLVAIKSESVCSCHWPIYFNGQTHLIEKFRN